MLKRLDLQGFKTFAARTTVELEAGITAVVGPNGSGKSNLADAIRWVLGEQSIRALRGRRTEDVIFAGSSQRAPSGMAEVVVTFDNRDGRFGLPFADVSVTRRAYRSGENEYSINRERARYRDVADLLARVSLNPNGHVVVGQGMGDAALSLRPEERRAFFEDAAGISQYQSKLASTRERLAETEANVLRATDLLAELGARLPDLEARAARACEAQRTQVALREALAAWYGAQWRQLSARCRVLADAAEVATARARDARCRVDEFAEQRRKVASDLAEADSALDAATRAREEVTLKLEQSRRSEIGLRERLSGLRMRIDDAEREIAGLVERADAEERSSVKDSEARAAVASRLAALSQALAAADVSSRERLARRRQAIEASRGLEKQAAAVTGQLAGNRAALEALARRRQGLATRREEFVRTGATTADEARAAAERRRSADEAVERAAVEAHQVAEHLRSASDQLAAAMVERQQHLERQRACESVAQAAESRHDLLRSWHDSLSTYYSGVKAVLLAARSGRAGDRLSGVVGPVLELVQVRPDLELAIETALGSHVQDVVVEQWRDAEAAIQMLKRTGAGRATFLPLDTLRVANRPPVRLRDPDVLGVAAELVACDPANARAVQHLLGNTLVVSDLPAARRVLAQIQGSWQIVTLGGEIVRSSGAVTGGADRTAGRGALARERELRDAPTEAEQARAELASARAELARAEETVKSRESEVARLRRQEREAETIARRIDAERQTALREEALLEQSLHARAREEERHSSDESSLAFEEESLRSAGVRLGPELARLREALVRTDAEIAAIDDEERAQSRRFSESRAAQAAAEQEQRLLDREIERHASASRAIQTQLNERSTRLRELVASAAEAESRLESSRAALEEAERAFGETDNSRHLAQTARSDLSKRLRALDSSTALLASEADAVSREAADAALGSERAAADRDALSRQVEHDLGPCDDDGGALVITTDDGVILAPSDGSISADQIAPRVSDLRKRLRALGPVSLDIIDEHDRTAQRHAFLSAQVRDLVAGSDSIRAIITELEMAIRTRFDETFAVMSESFSRNFATLFGGGVGRLVISDSGRPDSTGVDVVASIPGRRVRDLAQLSGGERALTAVALIFAVLEANPTPVCVLDEVDAALDEANVGRFCSLLRERSERTQFVVITHNRRTMESAAALYGVTMEDRATSRVLSLRLTGVPR